MGSEGRPAAKERGIEAPFVSFAIGDQISRIKGENTWNTSDRNAVTLVHNEHVHVTLIAFHKGASLHEHEVEGPITVYVVEGSIKFTVGDDTCTVKREGFLSLERTIPHDLEALEESVVLLTILLQK